MVLRSCHDPAENLHFLRQQLSLAFIGVGHDLRHLCDLRQLRELCYDEERVDEETSYEAET